MTSYPPRATPHDPVHGPTDLSDAHAVLVAVEEYAEGGDWNLNGPAEDALSMMRWLIGRGMPQDRITLLASPLARNEVRFAEFPGVTRRPADRPTVKRVFREELCDLRGDWLWVYWAGHGVQMRGNRWGLLYPESSSNDLSGVDVDNLVSLLGTVHLPAQRVRRATVVIDACRSALSPAEAAFVREPEPLTEEPQTNRERKIFLMRASQSGAAAKNTDGQGLFTSTLVGLLHERNPVGAPIDLDTTWAHLEAKFEALRAAGETVQVPTLHVRNWAESAYDNEPPPAADEESREVRQQLTWAAQAVLDTPGTSLARIAQGLSRELATHPAGEVNGPADLAAWALTRPHGPATLLHLLNEAAPEATGDAVERRRLALRVSPDRWLLCGEYDALVRLLDAEEQPAHAVLADTAGDVVGLVLDSGHPVRVVDQLEAVRGELGLPPLLRTVEHTAAALMPSRFAEGLRDWSLCCAKRLGLEAALLERREVAEKAAGRAGGGAPPGSAAAVDCVQIRLSGPDGDGRRTYQVWTYGAGGAETRVVDDTPKELAALQRDLDDVLARYARPGRTRVEFFLAERDLGLPVHRFRIGANQPVQRSLGTDFDVVVRCAEQRAFNEAIWRSRWAKAAASGVEDLDRLPTAGLTPQQIYGRLQTRQHKPGVVFTEPAARRPEALAEALTICVFAGVPIVAWDGTPEADCTGAGTTPPGPEAAPPHPYAAPAAPAAAPTGPQAAASDPYAAPTGPQAPAWAPQAAATEASTTPPGPEAAALGPGAAPAAAWATPPGREVAPAGPGAAPAAAEAAPAGPGTAVSCPDATAPAPGAEEGGQAVLRQLTASGRLTALPAALRTLRSHCDAQDDHPGRHLALLWDDPERPLPAPLALSAPRRHS
ncbi:caspase family protein [Streptomyces sp. NPDC053493]|uniref:VMAP-C domain-containing protein n=1 Tax=Streptomyces sp. NPDC053493 TaxID=3365705 RepID=UPI0037D5DB8F